jgi:hypothetical protein
MSFPKPTGKNAKAKTSWILWLADYGLGKFFDAMIYSVQGAESTCKHCGEKIYCDIVEGGGVPDWGSAMPGIGGLDYGCSESPDTCEDGTGGHEPVRRKSRG